MKQLVILSGKGGTGKTTVSASFIALARNKAYADCDVDAPNLQLIYNDGTELEASEFYGYQKAVKYDDYCINCGTCENLCRFGAIKAGKINLYECEGCGVCEAFCPSADDFGRKAIRLENNISGDTMVLNNNGEIFSTAELKMGNGASGKLVTQVRKNLYNSITNPDIVIIDGSPGIGCPVIASVTGVDMVLVVTEPTLSGIHDMERILETANRFNVITAVCINKYDINCENTQKIEDFCLNHEIELVGKIPFDPQVIDAVNQGKPIVFFEGSNANNEIRNIWQRVEKMLLGGA